MASNPVEAFLLEKRGAGLGNPQGWLPGMAEYVAKHGPSPLSEFGGSLVRAGGAATGAAVVLGTAAAATKLYEAVTKNRDYKRMLEHDPTLVAKRDGDPRLFNQMFTTLRTFNPDFSRDPIVAAGYMHQMMDSPEHAGGRVVDALMFRDKIKGPVDTIVGTAIGAMKSPSHVAR